MKLLFLSCLTTFCLSLAEAKDFKHFPVVNSRTDSARTVGRGAPAPARPPGNRERVRENTGGLQERERNQNVPKQVTPTTERNRVNRTRNKGRSRSNIRKTEKKVETAVAPVKQRTRTRTQVPKLVGASTRRQRPTVETTTLAPIALVGFSVAQPVVQQSFKKTDRKFTANTVPQSAPARKLNPIVQSEKASKTFSQSLIELFHPTPPSNINELTKERQQEKFTEAQIQSPKESNARFHNRPPPLRVKTKHQPLPFQSKSPQAQSFRSQLVQAQPVQVRTQPIQRQLNQAQPFPSQLVQAQPVQVRTQPIQRQLNQAQPFQSQLVQAQAVQKRPQPIQQQLDQAPTFQLQPVQSQQVQAQPIQRQPVQFQPLEAQSLQLQPFQRQQFNSEVPAPAFQAHSKPVQSQQLQAQTIRRQQVQFQPMQAQTLQLQPFQGQQFNSNVLAPAFQEKPSLFSNPIEIPQQEGAGASFSFEAIVG